MEKINKKHLEELKIFACLKKEAKKYVAEQEKKTAHLKVFMGTECADEII